MSEEGDKSLFWYRVKFLGLISVFVLPFVAGWMALYVFEWRPPSGNYGQLVQPVKKISWPSMQTTDGELLADGVGKRWAFILFAEDGCAAQCRENLFYMRQLRTLLGKNQGRLQNMLVSKSAIDADLQQYLVDYPDFHVIDGPQYSGLAEQFEVEGVDAGVEPRMYLVDPDNNFMMYYPAKSDEKLILDDLRSLMRLSQIG